MRAARLGLRQVRFEHLAFIRNPASAFFTLIFPIIFLVIFNLLFGNSEMEIDGQTATVSNFYVPAIAAFSVINACYTGLSMSIALARDQGQLKRTRGTPLPGISYLAGKVLYMVVVAFVLVALVTAFGAVFYSVEPPTNTILAFAVALTVGAAAFSALAFAIVSFIPHADAAAPAVNATILPLLFISDVFIPLEDDAPGWISFVGDLFPVKHLSLALQASFNPFESGAGWEPGHLAVLAAWGLFGVLISLRFFRWEPRV